jgi:hypothetical protein
MFKEVGRMYLTHRTISPRPRTTKIKYGIHSIEFLDIDPMKTRLLVLPATQIEFQKLDFSYCL